MSFGAGWLAQHRAAAETSRAASTACCVRSHACVPPSLQKAAPRLSCQRQLRGQAAAATDSRREVRRTAVTTQEIACAQARCEDGRRQRRLRRPRGNRMARPWRHSVRMARSFAAAVCPRARFPRSLGVASGSSKKYSCNRRQLRADGHLLLHRLSGALPTAMATPHHHTFPTEEQRRRRPQRSLLHRTRLWSAGDTV